MPGFGGGSEEEEKVVTVLLVVCEKSAFESLSLMTNEDTSSGVELDEFAKIPKRN